MFYEWIGTMLTFIGALKLPQHFQLRFSNHYVLINTKIISFLICCPHVFECFDLVTSNQTSKNLFYNSFFRVNNNESSTLYPKDSDEMKIETVQKILNCDRTGAARLFTLNKQFFKDNKNATDMLLEKCKDCEKFGITRTFIFENSWVLQIGRDELREKMNLLKRWNFKNLSSNFCLLELPFDALSMFTYRSIAESSIHPTLKNSNRITYLANTLKKDEGIISKLCIDHDYLLKMHFCKLKTIMDILLASGIDPKHIYLDIWVVRYSVRNIRNRLAALNGTVKRGEVMPWMLHCRNQTFERLAGRTPLTPLPGKKGNGQDDLRRRRAIKLRAVNRKARGSFATDFDYLSHRLNISAGKMEYIYQRYPPLRKVQCYKLKDMLDYLFSEGFTTQDILRFPRIFCHSLLTIKERLDDMKAVGIQPENLSSICCKTEKQFNRYIAKQYADQELATNTQ